MSSTNVGNTSTDGAITPSDNAPATGLPGKVVIVTGSSRGIGAAIARRFAAQGAKVAVNYIKGAEAARAVVEDIVSAGGEAHAFQANVAKRSEVFGLVDAVIKRWGRLDVLVNNSAVAGKPALLEDETEEQVDELLAVNYKGVLWGIQAAAKVLPSGGSIINISSLAARLALPTYAGYAATKAAVDLLSKTAARELGPRNIRVNSIAPGLIPTDMSNVLPPEMLKQLEQQTPLERRVGRPEEVADVAVYLASAQASWVTAQVIEVAGGW